MHIPYMLHLPFDYYANCQGFNMKKIINLFLYFLWFCFVQHLYICFCFLFIHLYNFIKSFDHLVCICLVSSMYIVTFSIFELYCEFKVFGWRTFRSYIIQIFLNLCPILNVVKSLRPRSSQNVLIYIMNICPLWR